MNTYKNKCKYAYLSNLKLIMHETSTLRCWSGDDASPRRSVGGDSNVTLNRPITCVFCSLDNVSVSLLLMLISVRKWNHNRSGH